jgi:hypothetical protein
MIRTAVEADAGQVAALAAALAQSFPFSPAAFAASYPALLAAPDACLLVADTGAALAGYLLPRSTARSATRSPPPTSVSCSPGRRQPGEQQCTGYCFDRCTTWISV